MCTRACVRCVRVCACAYTVCVCVCWCTYNGDPSEPCYCLLHRLQVVDVLWGTMRLKVVLRTNTWWSKERNNTATSPPHPSIPLNGQQRTRCRRGCSCYSVKSNGDIVNGLCQISDCWRPLSLKYIFHCNLLSPLLVTWLLNYTTFGTTSTQHKFKHITYMYFTKMSIWNRITYVLKPKQASAYVHTHSIKGICILY